MKMFQNILHFSSPILICSVAKMGLMGPSPTFQLHPMKMENTIIYRKQDVLSLLCRIWKSIESIEVKRQKQTNRAFDYDNLHHP